jgi:alpha-L-fucosidase 2
MKMKTKNLSTRWGEGYPLGNGHMGAMVLGSLPITRIELSENTFYSGEKSPSNNQKDAAKAFYSMREQAGIGNYEKVHEIAENFIGVRKNYGTNLPVGSFIIDYGIDIEKTFNYERSLDIYNGMAECIFEKGPDTIKEEVFVSHPDNIIVYHISTTGTLNVKFSYLPGNEYGKAEYGEDFLQFIGFAFETMHCDELTGVKLTGYGQILTDGTSKVIEDGIYIQNASDIRIYLSMNTNFKKNSVEINDMLEATKEHVFHCMQKDFKKIKKEHREDINFFMKKVDFKLASLDELVEKVPLLYQYGRYLLLSSSRSDSKLPAHLQGIWNDNVACRIGWTCDMHLDINTQMNYWPSEVTNLSETAEPLSRWIKDDLAKAGEIAALESYGLKGWVGELVSNAWGFAAPYWASPIAPCPTGGVWVLMQMWEHYLYTEDMEYLQKSAFPLIESAAEFFNEYVFEDRNTGYLTSGPSISPENSFIYDNKKLQISNGSTYEILMIRELFDVFLLASRLVSKDDTKLFQEVSNKIHRLLPYRILNDGTIAEWSHDFESADRQHRHTSHLLGLFPFSQINLEDTKSLCEAAQKTIEIKLTPFENWEDTGWARSMLLLYAARLCMGNEAYMHIKSMMTNLLEPNNLIYHPPTRGAYAFDHVYELDGNTGFTTGITEMLLQSQNGVLHFLPALPDEWKSGSITGLVARGNIMVKLIWEEGMLVLAELISKKDKTLWVRYQKETQKIQIIKNVPYVYKPIFSN